MSNKVGVFSKAKLKLLNKEEATVIFCSKLNKIVRQVTKKPIRSATINFVSVSPDGDKNMVTFIEQKRLKSIVDNRYADIDMTFNVWDKVLRSKISYPGKIRKILAKTNLNKDHIESIATKYYNSIHEMAGMKVLKNIGTVYEMKDSADRPGSLGSSCMRNKSYVDFYENMGLTGLVLYDKEKTEIIGRALLWPKVMIKGKEYKLMDRIYTFNSKDESLFKEWANKNGYIHKHRQSYDWKTSFVIDGDVVGDSLAYVELDELIEEFKADSGYPYVDTFTYADDVDSDRMHVSPRSKDTIAFTDLEGNYDYIDRYEDDRYCEYCEEYHRESDMTHNDDLGEYICPDHSDRLVNGDEFLVSSDGTNFLRDNLYGFTANGTTHYVAQNDDNTVTIEGEGVVYCENCHQYHLMDDVESYEIDGDDVDVCPNDDNKTVDYRIFYKVGDSFSFTDPEEEEKREMMRARIRDTATHNVIHARPTPMPSREINYNDTPF